MYLIAMIDCDTWVPVALFAYLEDAMAYVNASDNPLELFGPEPARGTDYAAGYAYACGYHN